MWDMSASWWERATGLAAVTNPPVEERALDYSIGSSDLAVHLGWTTPGIPSVTEHTAMQLSAFFRGVSIVASSIAGLPMRTMEQAPDATQMPSSSFLDSPGSTIASAGVHLTPFEWKELVVLCVILHGDAFLQHIYNGAGVLVALNPVGPMSVEVKWDDSAFGGKLFKVRKADGSYEEYDGSKMTQIMGMSTDGLRGMSVLTQARMSLGTAMAGDKAAHRQFANGAMIAGLVTPADGETVTPDEAGTIKAHIAQSITGVENAGSIPVINRRLAFTPWALSMQDAQFIESRTFSIDEIGRWLGVPPHLLGLTEKATSWGQGIAEQNRGLSRYTLSNFTNRIQERLSTLLPVGKWVEFDYSAFVKPSPEDEIKLLIDQVNAGLLTLNEARALRNMGPLDGGDLPRMPAGSTSPAKLAQDNARLEQGLPVEVEDNV